MNFPFNLIEYLEYFSLNDMNDMNDRMFTASNDLKHLEAVLDLTSLDTVPSDQEIPEPKRSLHKFQAPTFHTMRLYCTAPTDILKIFNES